MPSTHVAGYQWRYDVRKYLAERGIDLEARELGAAGDDLFDAALSIECKNRKTMDLAGWIDQAEESAGAKLPIVVAKRRGKPVKEGYAVLRLEDLATLLLQR